MSFKHCVGHWIPGVKSGLAIWIKHVFNFHSYLKVLTKITLKVNVNMGLERTKDRACYRAPFLEVLQWKIYAIRLENMS